MHGAQAGSGVGWASLPGLLFHWRSHRWGLATGPPSAGMWAESEPQDPGKVTWLGPLGSAPSPLRAGVGGAQWLSWGLALTHCEVHLGLAFFICEMCVMLKAKCSSLGDGGLLTSAPSPATRSQGRGSAQVMVASHVGMGPGLTGVTSRPFCSTVGLGKDGDEARSPGVPGQCPVRRHDWGCGQWTPTSLHMAGLFLGQSGCPCWVLGLLDLWSAELCCLVCVRLGQHDLAPHRALCWGGVPGAGGAPTPT